MTDREDLLELKGRKVHRVDKESKERGVSRAHRVVLGSLDLRVEQVMMERSVDQV